MIDFCNAHYHSRRSTPIAGSSRFIELLHANLRLLESWIGDEYAGDCIVGSVRQSCIAARPIPVQRVIQRDGCDVAIRRPADRRGERFGAVFFSVLADAATVASVVGTVIAKRAFSLSAA